MAFTANDIILAFKLLTVNLFSLRLTETLEINYYRFKKLKINLHCLKLKIYYNYCKTFLRSWDHFALESGILTRLIQLTSHKTRHKKVLTRDLEAFTVAAKMF